MALNLQGVPQRLYKYFAPERADAFTFRNFRYTPLGEFNDPFEGRPHFDGLATEEATLAMFDEHLPGELEAGYLGLPDAMRAQLPKEKYLELMLPAMRSGKHTFLKMMAEAAQTVIASIPQQLDQKMGALCLSEVCDSLLMWAHYGASHTGFVIEFNAHHAYFHQQKTENDELRHLRRVLYKDSRPSGSLTDLEGSEVFLVKSSHWSYEREWRIFRPLSDADKELTIPAGRLYLFQIPADAISGVILGARAPENLRQLLHDQVSNTPELSHVRLKSCYADSKEFAIRMREGAI